MIETVTPNQKIWQTVKLIPPGKVASYGQIADLAGLPGRARMVGKALKSCPQDMVVPWHRVLRSNGQIAFPAGSDQNACQVGLLLEEDVVVLNSRVSMKSFQWRPDLGEILYKLSY